MMRTSALALCGLLGLTSALTLGCEGRGRPPASKDAESKDGDKDKPASLDGPAIAEIDLSHGVPESRPGQLFGASMKRSYSDLLRVLRTIDEGKDAPKGVLLHLGASAGLSRAYEIGGILGELKKKIPVVCHADEYGNSTMLLAARACSKIWVSPAGGVESIGLAAQMLYGHKLLTRFNVAVDFLQVGKFKGAEEPFTRDGPSPEARESLEGTLRGLRAAWIDGIGKGRGKPEVAERAEDGPYSPDASVEAGLVDAVGYMEDARDDVKKLSGADRFVSRFGGGEGAAGASHGLAGILRAVAGSSTGRSGGGSSHVAILPAIGSITMTASTSILGGNDGINEKDFSKAVARLTKDSSVKAVVVRIDSPGGSALASDLIWKKLMKLRAEKPVVFSVGDMAASGGYYMACTASKIVAEPTSIVGSIGVVGGKLAFGKALDDLGVHAETIAASPDPVKAARASYMSAMTPWDQPTRDKVYASMKAIYDLFLKRVAEGRGTSVDKIAPSAEGRIFGGLEAKERGLVDEIGGLEDSIQLAIKLADLPKDAPVEVVGGEGGLFELLDEAEGGGDESKAPPAAMAEARKAAQAALFPGLAESMPEAVGFVGSLAPLVSGERAITALPFGLTVR